MLANEAKFLGPGFMAVRWILTVVAISDHGGASRQNRQEKDMPAMDHISHERLSVKHEYCVGCGVCAKMMPDLFEMKDNKAVVQFEPGPGVPAEKIRQTVQKCPTKAILYSPKAH